MFSKPLFKKTIKDNYKLWLGITAALTVMLVLLLVMTNSVINNPDIGGRPNGGGGGGMSINLVLEQFYTMFAMLLGMIYVIITANKLIAAQIDNGSMAVLMSRPVKRNQVSVTQAVYLFGSIAAMFSVVMGVGLAVIGATGLNIAIGGFMLLNLGIVLFFLSISGISFLASCLFNVSSKSLLMGAGIPVLFFLFNMLAGFSGMAEFMELFKYLSLNTLFSVSDIMAYSTNLIWQFIILFAVGAGCYTAGIWYFKKKDLPL
ncbi:MAG: ABC transporter permease [Firmicutes bacterium]|nr:ABC transporter permease [Bacillota bacterium]